MRWVGHVAHGVRNVCKILVKKPEGKRDHVEDLNAEENIRMDI
jgi:hypothetical protein